MNPDDLINPFPTIEREGEIRHFYTGSRDNCRVRVFSSYYCDDYGCKPRLRIDAWWYPVVRETPCGVWVLHQGKEKFILNGDGKRFAYPTLQLALKSFRARKRRQIGLLRHQLSHAEAAFAWVKQELLK